MEGCDGELEKKRSSAGHPDLVLQGVPFQAKLI